MQQNVNTAEKDFFSTVGSAAGCRSAAGRLSVRPGLWRRLPAGTGIRQFPGRSPAESLSGTAAASGLSGSAAAPGLSAAYARLYNNPAIDPSWPVKSKLCAGLLGIFLGTFGIHKFYMGKVEWVFCISASAGPIFLPSLGL